MAIRVGVGVCACVFCEFVLLIVGITVVDGIGDQGEDRGWGQGFNCEKNKKRMKIRQGKRTGKLREWGQLNGTRIQGKTSVFQPNQESRPCCPYLYLRRKSVLFNHCRVLTCMVQTRYLFV